MSATLSPPRPSGTSQHRRRHGRLLWLLPAGAFMVILAPVVLLTGAGSTPCTTNLPASAEGAASGGDWVATAYGPPWGGIQGDGITATGLNLTAGQPALEVAVDPTVVPLESWVHITPNPYNTTQAFYAGDTGGAITGKHVDIYDWQGRAAQNAWGKRQVTVTPAPAPGAGNLLDEITPTSSTAATTTTGSDCQSPATLLTLTAAGTATILPDGQATAPADAPAAVKYAIAAGNEIIDKPYLWGGGHGQPFTKLAAGYDCSGATSYVLHAAGLFGDYAQDAAQLESYGHAGPGEWITVYANSAHAFIDIAGVVLDTAHYTSTTPAGTGPRWQPESMIAAQYAGDEADDNGGFLQRHPQGF